MVPAQLPADVSEFAGRVQYLAALDKLLGASNQADPPGGLVARSTAVVISAIAGTAGVGKTALAVHWAQRVAGRFPDGQLYVNLRGFDPGGQVMDPADAVRGFLDAMEIPPQRIPVGLDAQAALYRSLLAGRRMLVVLDNARDADQVRPLLPGSPTCLVLATSRNTLAGLVTEKGVHPMILDLLTVGEARDLLRRRLGRDRIAAQPEAVDEIIQYSARLPLALTIVAARAALHPAFALHTVAADLRDARDRLDALTAGDAATDVRAVFSWSYLALTAEAARLFRLLGLHPGPDISASAAASLVGLSMPHVRPLLSELAHANLIVEHIPGRYNFHDLLRAYAAEQVRGIDIDSEREVATYRVLDHYLQTAHTAARLLDPQRDPIVVTQPQPGVTAEKPADHAEAMAWFTAEHQILLAAVDFAACAGLDSYVWQLAWTLVNYLAWRGHWHDQASVQHAAVEAARRLGESSAQVRAERYLASACVGLGHYDDARTHLLDALHLSTQAGDQTGIAHTLHSLVGVSDRQGRHAEALGYAWRALDMYRTVGHRDGQATVLGAIGWCYAKLGDHPQALTYSRQSLTLLQELGNLRGQASAWDSLGYAHHHLGQYAEAVTCYQHAVELYQDLGDRYHEANTLTYLGDAHRASSGPDAARHAWRQALAILDELDHPDAQQVQERLAALDRSDALVNDRANRDTELS